MKPAAPTPSIDDTEEIDDLALEEVIELVPEPLPSALFRVAG